MTMPPPLGGCGRWIATVTTKNQASSEETADLPGFKSPRRQPADEPLDPEKTSLLPPWPGPETPTGASSEAGPAPIDNENGAASWDNYEDVDEPIPTSSSRGGRSRGYILDPATFLEPIGALVGLASLGVHAARRAPDGLWIADEEDVDNIAAPLARIAARHAPMGMGEASDLADGIAAAIGVTNYAIKNIQREATFTDQPAPAPEDAQP
ncbi:MAG: hypothetical protein JWP02_1496 [Acidimicrobiales bacterium]|nr:hypothetical protein [Acidimicrobiales bacterium]